MASALRGPLRSALVRRAVTVPTVMVAAATLSGSVGLWAPIAASLDLAQHPQRMARLRIGSFALGWSVLESIGVGVSTALWAVGRSEDETLHFALQRWWANRLVDTLGQTLDLRFEVPDVAMLAPGPIVICAQHASVPDSLIPAWLAGRAGLRPRYVLKDELQLDPCLDIVGNRLPNHFVDREPQDSDREIALLEALATGMGERDACVIFPEGTVVTDERRERAKAKIEAQDRERAARIRSLRVLAPVRPGGTAALLRGAPDADLVLVSYTGLESLQRITSAPRAVPFEEPVRIHLRRVARADIPDGDEFTPWFDAQWLELDEQLDRA